MEELIVGLDIGTSKICAVVGEIRPDGTVDIIGMGSHPSIGLRKANAQRASTTLRCIRAKARSPVSRASPAAAMSSPRSLLICSHLLRIDTKTLRLGRIAP